MRLHVVRHGRTASNAAGRLYATEDEPILAEHAAVLSALVFDAGRFAAIYASPAQRCIDTARGLGLAVWREEPRLAERRFGILGGLTLEECRVRHSEAFAAFVRLDADFAPPQGESRAEHLARLSQWLCEVSAAHPPGSEILAVCHGGVVDFLYRMSGAAPLHGGESFFAADNLSVSIFDVEWPQVRLVAFSQPL
ncbi:MAG: histidine phosphatase family protein [Caulobacteraceae bacterium]